MGHEISNVLLEFLGRGGLVMWLILALSTLMWTLLLERYWYLKIIHPGKVAVLTAAERGNHLSDRLTLAGALESRLPLIRSLVYVLPLLGLLGTVAGMIQTFEILSVFGSRNPRGLSSGISQALLTTMAGLVTSLSGLYLVGHLSHRVASAIDALVSESELPQPLALSPLLILRNRLQQKPLRTQEAD